MAAIERYDGIFFRVLRRWLRTSSRRDLNILIISARFGLIEADTPIPNYDQRMTRTRALELAPNIRASIFEHLRRQVYQRIFVNIGKDYQATLIGIDILASAVWAVGPIGKRAQQMKRWLEAA